MFNYALEPACLYLCLIGKHSLVLCLCAERGENEENPDVVLKTGEVVGVDAVAPAATFKHLPESTQF